MTTSARLRTTILTSGLSLALLLGFAGRASAATITIDASPLSSTSQRVLYLNLNGPAFNQNFENQRSFDLADGTYTVRTYFHNNVYGTLTVSGGAITATTGALTSPDPASVGFDLSLLTRVNISLATLSSPANLIQWGLNVSSARSGDVSFYLPDGSYFITEYRAEKTFGHFDIVSGAASAGAGATVVTPSGSGYDITMDAGQLATITVKPEALSSPAGLSWLGISAVTGGSRSTYTVSIPAGDYLAETRRGDVFGSFRVELGAPVSVTALTGSVRVANTGPGAFDLDIDTAHAEVARFSIQASQLGVNSAPINLVTVHLNNIAGHNRQDFSAYVPAGAFEYQVGNNANGFGTFTLDANMTVDNITGVIDIEEVAARDFLISFDVCAMNTVTVRPLPGTRYVSIDPYMSTSVDGASAEPEATIVIPSGTYRLYFHLHANQYSEDFTVDPINGLSATQLPAAAPQGELELLACAVNLPPIADAGPDQALSLVSGTTLPVTLDGSGSSDPDEDTLTYTWTGGFGSATGVSPTIDLAIGVHTITLTVDDGQMNPATDEVVITVADGRPTDVDLALEDTYLRQGHPNQSQGADSFLRIRKSGKNRALLRCEQSAIVAAAAGRSLVSATIELTIDNTANNWGSGRTIDLHRMSQAWVELAATWKTANDTDTTNGKPDGDPADEWTMGGNNTALHPWVQVATATTLIVSNQTGTISLDVTADLAAFLSGAEANLGWILKKTVEGQNGRIEFRSKESGAGPVLKLVFAPAS